MLIGIALTIVGLTVFEIVNSVDNAVINADVLTHLNARSRRWFLTWGIFSSVLLVRGLAPWLIVWASTPGISAGEAFMASFSNDPRVAQAMAASAPLLLVAAGTFLSLLALHWLFLEEKRYGLPHESFIHRHGFWFYFCAATLLAVVTWFAVHIEPLLAFAATLGSSAFFLVRGFKENAERKEEELIEGKIRMTDLSKLLYLEAIDACFSVDGVLGAFAFTLSVPLILIGNGIGSIVVRQVTVGNIERVKRLVFLKNGAMYSIMALGVIMLFEGFGGHLPAWVSPVATFIIVGYFLIKSLRDSYTAPAATPSR